MIHSQKLNYMNDQVLNATYMYIRELALFSRHSLVSLVNFKFENCFKSHNNLRAQSQKVRSAF